MHSDHTVEIAAAPAVPWPLLTEEDALKQWNPDIVSIEKKNERTGVGALTETQIKEGSRLVPYDGEVVVWEPESCLEIELRGGSLGRNPMRVRYELTELAGRTRLRMIGKWRPSGVMLRLMSPLISILGKRNQKRAIGLLRGLAEK